MSGRDYASGTGKPSGWGSQEGPDIGVWNPVSVSSSTSHTSTTSHVAPQAMRSDPRSYGDINSDWRQQAQGVQPQAAPSVSQAQRDFNSDWRHTSGMMPTQAMRNVPQSVGDISSNWRSPNMSNFEPYATQQHTGNSQAMRNEAQAHGGIDSSWHSTGMLNYDAYSQQQYPPNPQGGSYQQALHNAAPAPQAGSNPYDQLPASDGVSLAGNIGSTPEYYSGSYPLNTGSNGSVMYRTSGGSSMLNSQSLSMTVPNYDSNERVANITSPGSFVNPLLDSSRDSATETADLLRNLEIEKQNFEKLIANKPIVPSHIPKSSLLMLQKQLSQAAEAFSSPEAYKLARERELGFHSIQDVGTTVIVSNLSAEAANFVPLSKSPAANVRVAKAANEEQEAAIISSLTKLIETVLLQPGNFDNLSAVFINQVRLHTHSNEIVEQMVDMIFNRAILEDNFKYLGARLCDKLTTPDVLNNFRTKFLNQLQAEFKKIDGLFDTAMEDNIQKIHGFVTFLAEIFIHIKINGQPIKALGKSFGWFLAKLISKPEQNVSFVCKMIKLSGAKLRDALSNDEQSMKIYDEVFSALKEHSDKQTDKDTENTKRMLLLITSVLRLKESNWGRTDSNTRKKSSIADPEEFGYQLSETDQNYYMNEPVFFTPEGIQYTAAEAQIPEFYDQHLAKFNVPQQNSDVVSFPWNPKDHYFDDFIPSDEEEELFKQDNVDDGFDDEFEKFLEESGQL